MRVDRPFDLLGIKVGRVISNVATFKWQNDISNSLFLTPFLSIIIPVRRIDTN